MSSCGFALILISGLVSLIGLIASALFSTAFLSTVQARAAAGAALARLTVESGLEYAESRLWRDGTPILETARTAANAGDDWTCRDNGWKLLPAALPNPSYSHGERWTDDGDGLFEPGEAWIDADRDGRFNAASGRLRGGGNGPAFSLRIRAAAALACVNSGELGSPLGDHDLNGKPNKDDPAYAADLDANGVPDWRDPGFPGNRHLVNLLNNLGAILHLSSETTSLYWPGDDPIDPVLDRIQTSTLGTQIVAHRPRGGYESLEPLKTFLSPDDFRAAAPLLAVSGDIAPVTIPSENRTDGFWRQSVKALDPARQEFHAHLLFNAAPVEILRANLRHIAASGTSHVDAWLESHIDTWFIRLQEGEADDVAQALAGARPIHAWPDFLRTLHVQARPLFRDDPFTYGTMTSDPADPPLPPMDEATDPMLQRLKEDLILAQVAPDDFFGDTHARRANTLEVPRENTGTDGGPVGPDTVSSRRILKGFLHGPLNTLPFVSVWIAGIGPCGAAEDPPFFPFPSGIPSHATTEFSLAPADAQAYRIECDGRVRADRSTDAAVERLEVELSVSGVIRLDGQQDFEQRGASLASPWRYPGGAVSAVDDAALKSGIDTGPKFPLDSYTAAVMGAASWVSANNRYAPALGGLHLAATREEDLEGACVFALPFNPDPAVNPVNRWYDHSSGTPNEWLDNAGDPVGAAAVHRSPTATFQSLPPFTVAEALHRGHSFSPAGLRFTQPIPLPPTAPPYIPFQTLSVAWDPASPPGSRLPLLASSPAQTLADGTITFWFPASGGESVVQGGGENMPRLELHYKSGGSYKPYLAIGFLPDERITVSKGAGSFPSFQIYAPPWSLGNPLASTGWHHAALQITQSGQTAALFIDGQACLPALTDIQFGPAPSSPPDWRIVLVPPLDDIRFHVPPLGAAGISADAAKSRYAFQGDYRSPRFRFDPALFPAGAAPRKLRWNAFIPAQTGGRFAFDVIGFTDAGLPLNGPQDIPWTGTGIPAAPLGIPGCREIEVAVRIRTQPTLSIDGQAALRDTPVLDEIEVIYADKPRLSGYSRR